MGRGRAVGFWTADDAANEWMLCKLQGRGFRGAPAVQEVSPWTMGAFAGGERFVTCVYFIDSEIVACTWWDRPDWQRHKEWYVTY